MRVDIGGAVNVKVDPAGSATVEFESVDELRNEYAADLAAGGISLRTDVALPLFSEVSIALRVAGGGSVDLMGTVVNHLPGAVAVAFLAPPDDLLATLEAAPEAGPETGRDLGAWERVRAMNRNEKMLLAPKASRAERAVLTQEHDAQVLYFLLKNPRITAEEVARIARSPQLGGPGAELIARTSQWSTSVDVRVSLVNNPKIPTPLALKLLPTLPEPEIRRIAKSTAVNQAIRQAALRIVVNRS